jgi:hypothetical protein
VPAGDAGLEPGAVTLLPDTYSAMQAVVDAARQAVRGRMGGYVALREALRTLDKAQAAQPEGERLSQ